MKCSVLVLSLAASFPVFTMNVLRAQQIAAPISFSEQASFAAVSTQQRSGPAPNFVVPLTAKQKFGYEIGQSLGVHGLLGSAIAAGVYQKTNTPAEWGEGAEGYGKRFGSFLATSASRGVFDATLESTFHQDPRYFPSDAGVGARLGSVVKQAFIVHSDSGSEQFAYARMGSAVGAAFLANSWNPDSKNSATNAAQRTGLILTSDLAWNCVQEFIPLTRPRAFRHSRP